MQAMVNRYCPASKRGEVNGTSQSLASLVRAVGPFFGGLLWGVFSGLALPGAQLIPFAIHQRHHPWYSTDIHLHAYNLIRHQCAALEAIRRLRAEDCKGAWSKHLLSGRSFPRGREC